ncbi:MAG: MOMP family protein, partial [Chlamydiia bacterium]|nr:MOMP family protein [Chlamydiia bacterium]
QHGYDSYRSPDAQTRKMSDSNVVCNSVHGCMSGFSIGAEFLWWRAQMDNLDYGLESSSTVVVAPAPGVTARVQVQEPDFEFDPGVRVSLGYDFGRRNWDIFLRWTYQYTDATDSAGSTDPALRLVAVKDISQDAGRLTLSVADTGRVKWQNQLNVLDFEMGYDYFLSEHFSLRPFFGVKAAWLDMDYSVNYTNVISTGLNSRDTRVSSKTDFWGVGPMVGMGGNLHIGWGFSLYAQTSAAFVYGNYDSDFKQTDTLEFNIVESHDSYTRQRAVGTIGVGVEWAWCFSGEYLLALNLGWEGQYWWNQYELLFNIDKSFSGDLTYTGLNAGIRFDF